MANVSLDGETRSPRGALEQTGRRPIGGWWGLLVLALASAPSCNANPAPVLEPPSPMAVPEGPPQEPAVEPAPAPPPPAARVLAFTAPAEGAVIETTSSTRAAAIEVSLDVAGIPSVELRSGNASVTLTGPPWKTSFDIGTNGNHEIQAIGRDASGLEVMRVIRSIDVKGLRLKCQDELKAQGVAFAPGAETREIPDPIALEPVIAGVTFRVHKASKPTRLLVACELGLRLARLAALAKEHGLDEVIHLGVHNYRPMRNPTCIKNNNCKLSQHAYATAIDIHAFHVKGSDTIYSTETDWIINKKGGVCPGAPQGQADTVLHQMACTMHAQKLFNIILTPNYNDLHRNHFHVDLTPASATIRGEDMGVDPLNPELLDE